MAVSYAIIKVVGMIPVQNEGIAYLGKPQISKTVMFITISILGSIGVISGVFPARRASKLDPVESLRYE
jgi:putative ABC transport system permease protein